MTTYRIRNWDKYQHYRDRNPPWVKLHFSLLSSADWVTLSDADRVLLVVCMLLASKSGGEVPGDPGYIQRVAYLPKRPNLENLIRCGFLVCDDASMMLADASTMLADARPETETETEERQSRGEGEKTGPAALTALDTFSAFWSAYPRKTAKANARISWKKLNPDADTVAVIMASVEAHKNSRQWLAEGGRYIPHAATWLNQRRWEDEVAPAPGQCGDGSPVPWKDTEA